MPSSSPRYTVRFPEALDAQVQARLRRTGLPFSGGCTVKCVTGYTYCISRRHFFGGKQLRI